MRALRVYLAAPYSMKDTLTRRAAQLRELDIEVASSWLEEPHKPGTQMHELTHEEHQKYALRDVDDVVSADLLIFQGDPTKTIIRAGRHVEFGIAVAIARTSSRPFPVFVIGEERENIFHHLPQVRHFATWENALYTLNQLAEVGSIAD